MPVDPLAGLFGPLGTWGTLSSGHWTFKTTTAGGTTAYKLYWRTKLVHTLARPQAETCDWIFLARSKFLVFRAIEQTSAQKTYRLFVFDIGSSASPAPLPLEHRRYVSADAVSDLHLRTSPDGELFFIYMSAGVIAPNGPTVTAAHEIIRASNGQVVASLAAPLTTSNPNHRHAEITSSGQIRIFTSLDPNPRRGADDERLTTPLPPPVAITNVEFNPHGLDYHVEHVVIDNAGSAPVVMTGWTLMDRGGHVYRFPSFTLAGNGRVRVWTKTGRDDLEDLFMNRTQPMWNNPGDVAVLRDVTGTETGRYRYPRTPLGYWGVFAGPPPRDTKIISATVTVFEADGRTGKNPGGDVDTGIDVQESDRVEICARGEIWAGVPLTPRNGPEGWDDLEDDPNYPLCSGPQAHPYALIGRLGIGPYFYIGRGHGPTVFRAPNIGRLFLRTNDDAPGNGSIRESDSGFLCTIGIRVPTIEQAVGGSFLFSPPILSIVQGQRINVRNMSAVVKHTFTIPGTPIEISNGPRQEQQLTIDLPPGRYSFTCVDHEQDGMVGTLIVE